MTTDSTDGIAELQANMGRVVLGKADGLFRQVFDVVASVVWRWLSVRSC